MFFELDNKYVMGMMVFFSLSFLLQLLTTWDLAVTVLNCQCEQAPSFLKTILIIIYKPCYYKFTCHKAFHETNNYGIYNYTYQHDNIKLPKYRLPWQVMWWYIHSH